MMSKRKHRIKPVEDAMSYILSSRDKPCFADRFINNIKGRGVFATEPIEQGSFVLEYRGEFMSVEECRSRHYSETQSTFLYEFDWQKRQWCIDASKEDGSLGRLVNDNHKSPNCIMKKVVVNNKPHLCLFAVRNIEIGTELDYNYGDSKWPWRKKTASKKAPAVAVDANSFPTVLTSPEDTKGDYAGTQVTYQQAPSVEEEIDVLPVNLSAHDDDDDDVGTKVTYQQAPSVEEEIDVLPVNLSAHDDDDDDVGTKVTYQQAPSVEEEIDVLPVNLSAHDDDDDDVGTKVTYQQAPSVEEEIDVLPVNLSAHEDDDDDDDVGTKKFTVKGSSLVDYSDTDETSENCDQPLGPHCDEVVPKLRRTKSIRMKKVPDFSDALYDSSDDSTGGPSTQSKSEKASQRMDTFPDFQQPLSDSDESIVEETNNEDSETDHSDAKDKSTKPGKTRVQALCAFAEPSPPGLSNAYWKFLQDMNQDEISVAVKQDSCILEYGYRLFKKNERIISQHQHIRQKLRELGRLILAARKVAPVKTIKELIKPEKYAHVVAAARCLAGFSDETGKYKCPSLARKVGHSLHALAMFVKSEWLKARDKETVQNAEDFAQLYKESWKFDVASQALIQLDQSKWNSPQLLPFTQDVQILHSQLSEKQQQHLDALKEEISPSNWKELAKVTLAQVILFNRRREGEVSKMPLSVYLSRDQSETYEDVNLALTELEQKLCKHFVRITIVGKRGRKVPVLLTPLMKQSLDTLVEKREECGVLTENGYLFALPHSIHHLRGSDCIRQFVHECSDIKHPEVQTSTKLRKHVATLSTVLNLKNTELDQLADFLGHNIDVHRKHYRLPEGTLQLAKISKVLLALEKGQLGKYKGKSLDEIHIDPNETVETEACSQEDMEDAKGSEDEANTTSPQESASSSSAQNQRKKFAKKRVANIAGAQEEESEEDGMMPLPDSSSVASAPNQRGSAKTRDASMTENQWSEDEASTTSVQESTSTASAQNQRKKFAKKRGKQAAVKRNWTPEECAAVERHLKTFIVMNQVPGKEDCQRCITVEPQALRRRDWRAVKYFIKNRISSLRRKLE